LLDVAQLAEVADGGREDFHREGSREQK